MEKEEPMLTVMEYAVKHRLHVNTVHRMLWEKRLPGAIKMGKSWRIPATALPDGVEPVVIAVPIVEEGDGQDSPLVDLEKKKAELLLQKEIKVLEAELAGIFTPAKLKELKGREQALVKGQSALKRAQNKVKDLEANLAEGLVTLGKAQKRLAGKHGLDELRTMFAHDLNELRECYAQGSEYEPDCELPDEFYEKGVTVEELEDLEPDTEGGAK